MTICTRPGCNAQHKRAPMTAFEVRHATMDVLHRAAELREEDATSYLRVTLMRIALELSGWCPNCVLQAQGDVAGAISMEVVGQVRDQHGHVHHACAVIPIRGTR